MPKRVDKNQPDIVAALRKCGATVQHLHAVGDGCPDLLVGYGGVNLLVEVKRDLKSLLTDDQRQWHGTWRGQVTVLFTVDDVPVLLNSIRGKP